MNLIDYMYQQKSYGEVLHALGIPLDEVSLIPFADGKTLIADLHGNAQGFITENIHGGIDVSDASMNTIGSTTASGDFTLIHDEHFQQVGLLEDNVLGGTNLYQAPGQVEMISSENLFFGYDYYDSHMQLLGSSNETINQVATFSMNEQANFSSNFYFSFDTNFSNFLPITNGIELDSFASLGADVWSVEAADLFEIYDLFW